MIHTTMTGRMASRLVACIALAVPLHALAGEDRLDTPALQAPKASAAMMLGVARTGNRVVAVGEYGLIIYSDTNGETWQQADVPVSVTLTAIKFPTPSKGWAVGHDGVILHSDDAGKHWKKEFDGNKVNALVVAAAEKQYKEAQAVHAGRASGQPKAALEASERLLDDAKAGAKFGPARPFLDLWFKNESEGIVVGAFGQIFHTANGGQTWELWSERLGNRDSLHYNAISATGLGVLMISSEAGKLFRSNDGGATWVMLDTGYAGQMYGVISVPNGPKSEVLVAYGFGGNIFRSTDNGEHWTHAALTEKKSVVSGTVMPDGSITLLTYNGKILRSVDQGESFKLESANANMSAASLAQIDSSTFIVAGTNGTRIVTLQIPAKAKQP